LRCEFSDITLVLMMDIALVSWVIESGADQGVAGGAAGVRAPFRSGPVLCCHL
jgi:hypothetical protein